MNTSNSFWSRFAAADDPVNRRRAGRLNCAELKCTLGTVVDVSMRGFRVMSKKDPEFLRGQIFEIELESMGQAMLLPAKLVWVKKVGRRFECGLETIALGAEKRSALKAIAQMGTDGELLRPRGS